MVFLSFFQLIFISHCKWNKIGQRLIKCYNSSPKIFTFSLPVKANMIHFVTVYFSVWCLCWRNSERRNLWRIHWLMICSYFPRRISMRIVCTWKDESSCKTRWGRGPGGHWIMWNPKSSLWRSNSVSRGPGFLMLQM